MQRNFCDMCGKELDGRETNAVSDKIEGSSSHLCFNVTVGQNGKYGYGEYCRGCVFDAIASVDKRPKEMYAVEESK